MFSVYGLGGPIFRGVLEDLAGAPGVLPARNPRGIAREGEEPGVEFRVAGRRETPEKTPSAEAAATYAKMLTRDRERGPVRHAYQVMSRDVLSLRTTDTVATAWRSLAARRVRQAPVLNPEMDLVGMVSERELLTVIDLQGERLTGRLDRTVGEVMRTPVVCADPITDIRRIARVLLDTGLSALPVASESRQLVGVVSRGDILRATVADPPLSLWV